MLSDGAAVLVRAQGVRGDGFGRWQQRTARCELTLADDSQTSCTTLQLDQPIEGLLRLSLLGPGPERGEQVQWSFVGQLLPDSQPMACRVGHCVLEGPLRISLNSVSQTSFDGRGVAQGLPRAWPAEGRCGLEAGQVLCEARALSGETWRVRASLP